jgi:superfamily II DNA or RNA helicase
MGLLAAQTVYELIGESINILIVVPTTNLKENEWVNEIAKWFPHLEKYITIECIHTAYKQLKVVDLLIVDEIHSTLSPEYRKLYTVVEYNYIIGLTATKPHIEEYNEFLNQVCPIVFEFDLKEAKELELISGFKLINTPVPLTRGERRKYDMYDKMFTSALIQLSEHGNAFTVAEEVRKDKNHALYKTACRF